MNVLSLRGNEQVRGRVTQVCPVCLGGVYNESVVMQLNHTAREIDGLLFIQLKTTRPMCQCRTPMLIEVPVCYPWVSWERMNE